MMEQTGLQKLAAAFRRIPRSLPRSLMRHGMEDSARTRAQVIFSNVFLHIHPARTHRYTLKWNYTFGLGIMLAVLFAILTVTGLFLMIYYKPSEAGAYNSMKDIMYIVPSGRMVRNIHRWAAHLMVVAVFLHMARVFFTGSYKRGREFNWLIGMGLFVLTLALSFTGYLLPWDQLAYWAVTIGANIAASPREVTDALGITAFLDIGGFNKHLLLGADQIGDEAIVRFNFLHVIFLPLMTVFLMMAHVWRIRKDGGVSRPYDITEADLRGVPKDPRADESFQNGEMKSYTLLAVVDNRTPAVDKGPENSVPSWPHALVWELTILMITLAVTMALSYFFDAPLKEAANPVVPENPAKAPWYFLGLQELVSYSAFAGGLLVPTLALIGLSLIPYLDVEQGRIGRWFEDRIGRRVAVRALVFSLVTTVSVLLFLVKFGWLRNWFPEISQLIITAFNPGTVITFLFAVWSILEIKRTNSVRHGAIALFVCFLVGFTLLTYFGTYHRGPNWDFYWLPGRWPVH